MYLDEEWKDVLGYEGYYKISNHGRLYSIRSEKILKQSSDYKGYMRANICVNGNRSLARIHRLVAIAFLQNEHNYPNVNHIDENPSNNHFSNLEWCTTQYNNTYGGRLERVAETTRNRMKKQIYQYSLDGKLIQAYNGLKEVKSNGFSQGAVSSCCTKRKNYNTHKGYMWSYSKI